MMHSLFPVAILASSLALATPTVAQPIIAQSSGLKNPDHVITFGAKLYPNFTKITTQFAGITVAHARYFTTGVSNNLVGGFLTNDFSGSPDTLKIKFHKRITDLSFVYHQISTSRSSVFRAMLGGKLVASFSNKSNQKQTNNYFGFTNILFDELQLDFVSDFNVDTLAFNDPRAKCTFRNGKGINPADYTCTTPPVLGKTWQGKIVQKTNTTASFVALGLGGPHAGIPFLGGEVLIQLAPALILIPVPTSGTLSIAVPAVPSSQGVELATQGARVDVIGGNSTLVLLNAQDLRLGT